MDAHIKYPSNDAVCETNEQWAGRNLLRKAMTGATAMGKSREYKGEGPEGHRTLSTVMCHDRPVYWFAESPETEGRQFFPLELAERDASNIRAFLEANGVNVTAELEPAGSYIHRKPWEEGDLVRVYGNGSYADPHANDPATVAMLPGMRRTIWNLVRNDYEPYEF